MGTFGYACDRCRKKHQSCDHNQPCQRCIKAGSTVACNYTPKRPRTLKSALASELGSLKQKGISKANAQQPGGSPPLLSPLVVGASSESFSRSLLLPAGGSSLFHPQAGVRDFSEFLPSALQSSVSEMDLNQLESELVFSSIACPSPDFLQNLHSASSRLFHQRARLHPEGLASNAFDSFDSGALVATGVLFQEYVKEAIASAKSEISAPTNPPGALAAGDENSATLASYFTFPSNPSDLQNSSSPLKGSSLQPTDRPPFPSLFISS